MTLNDCKKGDYVTLWCIGRSAWDDDVVKIVKKGILIKVKYRNGTKKEFSSATECKIASF